MLKPTLALLTSLFAFGMSPATRPPAAIIVPNADIQATLAKASPNGVSDQAIRMVDLGDVGYSVGVSVVRRPVTGGPVEHDKVTEIYHIISGSGTILTGGKLIGGKPRPLDSAAVITLDGPSMNGTAIEGGEAREVGPGDAIIVPAGINHQFIKINDPLTYIVIRVDPGKLVKIK